MECCSWRVGSRGGDPSDLWGSLWARNAGTHGRYDGHDTVRGVGDGDPGTDGPTPDLSFAMVLQDDRKCLQQFSGNGRSVLLLGGNTTVPLDHSRRVLLSAMYLRVRTQAIDVDSWGEAKAALIFHDGLDFLKCEGRRAGHELFIERLGDNARLTMCEFPVEDLVSLLLGNFNEEDQECTVAKRRVWLRV